MNVKLLIIELKLFKRMIFNAPKRLSTFYYYVTPVECDELHGAIKIIIYITNTVPNFNRTVIYLS